MSISLYPQLIACFASCGKAKNAKPGGRLGRGEQAHMAFLATNLGIIGGANWSLKKRGLRGYPALDIGVSYG